MPKKFGQFDQGAGQKYAPKKKKAKAKTTAPGGKAKAKAKSRSGPPKSMVARARADHKRGRTSR